MRVLQVSRCVLPLTENLTGGAEHFLIQTSRHLAEMGHEVHIVADASPGITEELKQHGIEVHKTRRFPRSKTGAVTKGFYGWIAMHLWGNLAANRKARYLIKQHRFDVVHHHGSLAQVLHGKQSNAIPTVFTLHDAGPWLGNYAKRTERVIRKGVFSQLDIRAAKKATHVTVVFGELKDHLVDRWNIDPSHISVINPGVDIHKFKSTNVPSVRNGFLFTGHMIKRKGVNLLGPIVKRNPDFHMTFVGDGPELQPLKSWVKENGITDRVVFSGASRHEDLPNMMRSASALVLPASSEGLPLTILESLSSSTPVLAFNVGGIKDAVTDSWNGYLVDPLNTVMLESRMRQIVDGGSQLVQELGLNGRKTAVDHFSWPRVTDKIENTYNALTN